jgi:hypothetical protein
MEDCLIKKIENFSLNFWTDLNTDYLNYVACTMFQLRDYLETKYKLCNEEITEYVSRIEIEVYENLKKEITIRSKEISHIAIDLFRKKFWYERENIQRNWNRLKDEEIDNLFKECKSKLNEIFENFKNFKIIRNTLFCINKFL